MENQQDEIDSVADDLLIGGAKVRAFLKLLGFENADPYYFKKRDWPIGKTGSGQSAKLVASKRRLIRYAQAITIPPKKSDPKSDAA
jgi:hypothetical protein